MLEIKFVRQNLDLVQQSLKNRGETADWKAFTHADQQRKTILAELEQLRHKRNIVSDEIAVLKKNGKDAQDMILEMRKVGDRVKQLEKEMAAHDEVIASILMGVPNIPHASVPVGKDENDNILVKTHKAPPDFDFDPLPHWDIGERCGILDLGRASQITGARFPLLLGDGALLERALINFMLNIHTVEHRYKEVLPPFIVNRQTMTNTGQLPKFEEDLFKIEGWDYFLIPTAEVPVTNILQGEILEEERLPVYYTAFTPCFRSEAGSYGKDTRGLIRQHQFNKIELVKFTTPETSYDELETLLGNAETILQRLELPYRVVTLCTGDLGFSAAKTYDIEVWMPAQGVYREISSCSNFEDFQARRANIRFKRKGQKGTQLVHTLNGSGLAVGRTLAAILENCQQPDGSVIIPEALRSLMGGKDRISHESK
ncbi:MAG: serine--tRNA ligase [Desulfobacteraceae bacterium]